MLAAGCVRLFGSFKSSLRHSGFPCRLDPCPALAKGGQMCRVHTMASGRLVPSASAVTDLQVCFAYFVHELNPEVTSGDDRRNFCFSGGCLHRL